MENDGRWIANIPELPGVTVYGESRSQAVAKVKALALRVIAEEIEHGEFEISETGILFAMAA